VISIRIAIVGLGNNGRALYKSRSFLGDTIAKRFNIDLSAPYSLIAKCLEKAARIQNSRLQDYSPESRIELNFSSLTARFCTCTLTYHEKQFIIVSGSLRA
jgi:hypothetical protein